MEKPTKLWNSKYITFIFLQTLNFALLYFTFPVIPKYSVSLGYDLSQAGVLSGGFAIASLLARPVTGFCIDNFDRKKVLIISITVCGLATAALSVTSNIWVLLVFRLIYGAAFAFSSTTLFSCGTDCIPEDRTAEGVGYFGLGIALSAAIGPPVGLLLNNMFGARILFYIMGGLSIVIVIWILFVKIPKITTVKVKEKVKLSPSSFIEKKAIILAVLVIPFAFSNGFINSFITLTAESRHIVGISAYFTVFAIAMMVLKPISGKMQDKFGLSSVLIPAFICTAIASSIISFAGSLALMIVAALLMAFGQGAGQPSLQSATVTSVEKARQGVAIGTYYIGLDLGNGIGNIAGGAVADALGYHGAYILCAGTLVAGLVVYIVYALINRRRNHEANV
ncbi:MAG: MFS transporter [Lachnospiraceae bacterium]|nr:MFS transporter [Lachnospiraceae bacterium]